MFGKIWIALFLIFLSYTIWIYACCDEKIVSASDAAKAGWQTWQEKNCQSCHQLYGLGGYMGPDLTNTASIKGVHYMETYIKYGTGRMPDYHLSNTEVKNLVAFLSWVDKTGTSIVPENSVHWSGSYIIDKKQ